MRMLAIETSCDETALALVEGRGSLSPDGQSLYQPRFKVLKQLISSQIKIHRPFGGVVPNLAKREHTKNLPILLNQLINSIPLKTASKSKTVKEEEFFKEVDLIVVTVGPGLEPALWTGITFAQNLAKEYQKPLAGANHLEGHLYSFLLSKNINAYFPATSPAFFKLKQPHKSPVPQIFPAIALIVSGGHTLLLKMISLTQWKKIGETRDDAVGEAFDKVARILGLPYPGGPAIEKLAKQGKETINFPKPMINHQNYDFSFSGLKTAVLYFLRDHPRVKKADIAASFQEAAIEVLVRKTIKAAEYFLS
jgi:N6-L-threonylcarbamoyladenine synthase